MNNAMESWIQRASRGAVRVGALLLLVCLTLTVNSLPTPTFKAATVLSSPHQLYPNQNSPTQSTVVAKSAMSWDDKTAATTTGKNRSETRHLEGNNRGGVILSTVQTSVEDSHRISTRMRRMSNRKRADNGIYVYGNKQMHCRNGYWLAIYDNETVNGTTDKNDLYTHLRITSVMFGAVKIQGVLSEMFVCMNSHGKIYLRPSTTDECFFKEELLRNLYTVFSSQAYYSGRGNRRLYIGLGKDGRPRLGRKTKKKHQTTHFIVEEAARVVRSNELSAENDRR